MTRFLPFVVLIFVITSHGNAATTAPGNNIIWTVNDAADGHAAELRINFFMLQDSTNPNLVNVWAQLTSQVNAVNLGVSLIQATPGPLVVTWANGRVQSDNLPLQIVYDPTGSGSLPSGGALITSYLGNATDGAVSTIVVSGTGSAPAMTVTFASGSGTGGSGTSGTTSPGSSSTKRCGLGSGMSIVLAAMLWWRGRSRASAH